MRFIKPLIGVFLILAAAAGLIYWEIQGRQMIMQEKVMVATRPILPGERVSSEMFSTVSLDRNSLMDEALREMSFETVKGKFVKQYIPKNAQISMEFFAPESIEMPEGSSIFTLKPGWIDGRSTSVRKEDHIEIYDQNGEISFGEFKVAFVKDDADKEVSSSENGNNSRFLLERSYSTGCVSYIEIITTVQKYGEIVRFIEETGKGLLIVQSGDCI